MNESIAPVCAIAAAIGFGAMMVFQLALAAGAPWGKLAWGGMHERLPMGFRVGSVISAGVFVFAAVVVLERVGLFTVLGRPAFVSKAVWFFAAFFAIGIVMNLASRSPWEQRVMTPVAFVLSALCFALALSAG